MEFVEIRNDVDGDTIVYPDYPSNNMFCTLGNVEAHSRIGLLFVYFADGRTLQGTGNAEIIWDDDRVAQYEGAERLAEITVDRTVELPNGNPCAGRSRSDRRSIPECPSRFPFSVFRPISVARNKTCKYTVHNFPANDHPPN